MASRQITSTLASMRAKQFIVTSTEISYAHKKFQKAGKTMYEAAFWIKALS